MKNVVLAIVETPFYRIQNTQKVIKGDFSF